MTFNKEEFEVVKVENNNETALRFIKEYHYARRRPAISYLYLIKREGRPIGAISYGKPASNALCEGVCGVEYKANVYELNRVILVEATPKNTLSWALSETEKDLKKAGNFIIVSYSDTGMHHNGYIYQATNYLYTGTTKERTDKYTPGGKHSRHYNDEHNHLRKVRTAKNRYVKFIGDRRFRREMQKALNYPVLPYPKKDNKRYKLGERMKDKIINRKTGEFFYE